MGMLPQGVFDTLRSLVVVGVYTGRGDLTRLLLIALFGAPEVIGTHGHTLKIRSGKVTFVYWQAGAQEPTPCS